MLARSALMAQLQTALGHHRVVALLGPRQCGKTTLARQLVSPDSLNYFDLEDPVSLARLDEPMTALRPLTGLVVIDEVQRRPDLFPVLRVLADRQPLPARFLILGSATPAFLRQPSESLAGRLATITLGGFNLAEVGVAAHTEHWVRGGFPLSFLADSAEASWAWRQALVQTLVERDIPLLVNIPPTRLRRLWAMLAHYHGQHLNVAELARALDMSESTVRRYVDVLEGVYMIRQLRPWHTNLLKRQVKTPKVYFRDSGLLHALLGLRTEKDLLTHPRLGASWEGYALEESLRALQPDEAYFWGTHSGAELDLLVVKNGQRWGVEFKRVDAPRLTASMHTARHDLELQHLWVVYPGLQPYLLAEGISAMPLADMVTAPPI